MKRIFIPALPIILLGMIFTQNLSAQVNLTPKEYLDRLLKVTPPDITTPNEDQLPGTPAAHVSPQDLTWRDWLRRTGELPPDFDQLPSLPFLPDPLILDEGGKNIPVETVQQWQEKRKEMTRLAQHWITGTVPPAPDNLQIEVLETKMTGPIKEQTVLLKFGPGHKGQLHVNILTPPGKGPFPVFMCQWMKGGYQWVESAVRRGYIGCRFTATDPKYGYPDDSEGYESLYWPDHDFSTIMRWGWAASRAIDYLYTLDNVNKEQIALTGLSRNGKMSLWAAAYDERIKAVVPISGGTGGEDPFRYTTDRFNNENMPLLARYRPHWLNPHLRFFSGMESKMPVDENSLMALIAPRGLMLTSSVHESAGNPWGIEQAYLSAKKAYDFLGAGDKIALDLRFGLHAPAPRDVERYLDFFDYTFGRGHIKPENKLYYDYSFSKWLGQSKEMLDPLSYPVKGIDDLLTDKQGKPIRSLPAWKEKVTDIKARINWGLGVEPPSIGPGNQSDYLREVVGLPRVGKSVGSRAFLYGSLYYPLDETGKIKGGKLPVIIWLHEYTYSSGASKSGDMVNRFVSAGYAVYLADQLGFGTRLLDESRLFYDRFPNWSRMGRMVADVRWAVDKLSVTDFIDPGRIYAAGYSIGATVGLYSAALDERIKGVVSVCGFSPMRLNTPGKTAEGIYEYSHLHGLLPRLGFFVKNESRIPYDFHEILGAIAPRPLLVIAPTWDQYASSPDVQHCLTEVKKVYELYQTKDKIESFAPEDYNHFTNEMKDKVVSWIKENF